MVRIAVTGGIACGKSLVGSFLEEAGVAVCEADDLAHEAMAAGREVHARVVEAFGDGVVADTGEIDRGRLGDRVFRDQNARTLLNAIVHPVVATLWGAWLQASEVQGSAVSAVIVPLLHEGGFSEGWDSILCVVSPLALRLERLRERGIDDAGAKARIQAQWSDERKAELSDHVIENDGSKELLRERTLGVLDRALKRQE